MPKANSGERGNESAFFKLIPRGKGFKRNSIADDDFAQIAEVNSNFISMEQAVECLLRVFNYKNRHQCDLEAVLYLKPFFILSNRLPQLENERKIALRILAADSGVLFKDDDRFYRNHYINAQFLSETRNLFRGQHGETGQEHLIQQTLLACTPTINLDANLSKTLLQAIVQDAAKKRRSVFSWLYSAQHIGITDENRTSYEENYKCYPDGYYDPEKRLPKSKRGLGDFIKDILAKKEPASTWLLDIAKCTEVFQRLLKESEKDLITHEFTEAFISYFLCKYIQIQQTLSISEQEASCYHDQDRINDRFDEFIKRYTRLQALEHNFLNVKDEIGNFTDITNWCEMSKKPDKQAGIDEDAIEDAIKKFFQGLGMPFKDSTDFSHLKNRIRWVCYSEKVEYDKSEKPLLILRLLLKLKRGVTKEHSPDFNLSQHGFPKINQASKSRQRYEEIKLLCRLYKAFRLSWSEKRKSWNSYFVRGEKAVQSCKEVKFWRKLLKTHYEDLPIIGFQLYFMDRIEHCLSPHYGSLLSYQNASKAHLGGFQEFLSNNFADFQELAQHTEEEKSYFQRYIACWKSPESTTQDCYKILQPEIQNFSEYKVIKICPNDEYKLLIIESAIRIRIIENAKEKLYKWFCSVYQCQISTRILPN